MALKRNIGLISLVLFGVGDILGAGIYGLVGKAAGQMGYAVWIAFLVSAVAAIFTGLSYATLGSRHPKAAGTAYMLQHAFGHPAIAYIIGLAVCASGITSMATAARVLSGYLNGWLPSIQPIAWIVVTVLAIGFIVYWGIRESLAVNAVCTIVEAIGLLIIIVVGLPYLSSVTNWFDTQSALEPTHLSSGLILSGAVLTFYSFIGFEDILNVSEEVKDPSRTLPKGLILAVLISASIYILVSAVAVAVVPPQMLGQSQQPLVDVVAVAAPGIPIEVYRMIALFAVSNTLLLNFVMSTRLLYGMSRQNLLPQPLSKLDPKRHTPYVATIIVGTIVLVLAIAGDVGQLARATAVLLLLSFTLMNAALIVMQRRKSEPRGHFEAPRFVPYVGVLICLLMLAHSQTSDWQIAGVLLAVITILYLIMHPGRRLFRGF